MSKPIEPQTLMRIFSMYEQGYTFKTIENVTKIDWQIIARRCRSAKLVRKNVVRTMRQPHKYDHLFDEPTAQGKFYKEYLK